MNTPGDTWNQLHDKYAQEPWVNKPSLFALWAIRFFKPPGRLLELGAGQGQDTRFFAAWGFHVVSTDISLKALGISRRKVPDVLGHRIELRVHDLNDPLPFTDCSFSIVYAHLSVHYFDDARTQCIFDEIYRVLKPGGIVAALLNSTDDPEYATSTILPDGVVRTPPGVIKRFSTVDTLRPFVQKFQHRILDNQGESYKDSARAVRHLIRFIGCRPLDQRAIVYP